MNRQTVNFDYEYLGRDFPVTATFTRYCETPASDGPYDADWELEDVEVIGEDGFCCWGEMQCIKVGDSETFGDLIEAQALEEME